jgi:hypothetical protein
VSRILLHIEYAKALIAHMCDCEDPDCALCLHAFQPTLIPRGIHKLIQDYEHRLLTGDSIERALARAQLAALTARRRDHSTPGLDCQARRTLQAAAPTPGTINLADLISKAVGPLRQRTNGTYTGPCPWHGSKAGQGLAVWPVEGRWWWSSCKRHGDAAGWLQRSEGIDNATARRRLRVPRPTRQA